MNWDRHTLWNAAWPALSAGAGGVLLSLCVAPGVMMPLCVAVSAVAGSLLTAVWVHRGQQEAKARLRHPELSSTRNPAGIFGEVTQAAVALLQQYESELQRLTSSKGELEVASKLQKKQARRLETALRAIDQPIVMCDTRDHVLFANSAARQLGIIESEGMSHSGTYGDLGRLLAFQQLVHDTRTRAAAAPRRTAELNFTIGQHVVPYRTTVTALFDDHGELLGTLAVLTDVREEKSAKTRHAEFVSSVAHEFKTPMASIKAFLELLVDGDVTEPDEQKAMFEKIDSQVDRLNRLVGNLLNLARIESGAVKVAREDCDLNDVVGKAADVVKPLAEERGQQFVTDLSQMYLPVHVDRDLLGQAIINLLSNAVKYTPQNGRITLRSHMAELEAIISVEDTGYGIPAESLPKIFDRFYRVPEHQHSAKGTGLGLAFVQSIVQDLHNGHIDVESTVGVGSKFSVRIPLGHHDTKRPKKTEPKPESKPDAAPATVAS
jgi:two-component system phosphate regulon sensor histidine kinase PhoR